MSSIIEQATQKVQTGESRFAARGNVEQLVQQRAEADFASEASAAKQKTFQAVSQYQQSGAEQEKIQGQQLVDSGSAKQSIGGGMMGIGFTMIAVGTAMSIFGGAGAALIASGMTSVAQGMGQIITGGVDVSNGQAALLRANEKLEKATANQILSKQEAKVVSKEMNRSKILEFKIAAMKDLVEVMKPMLEEMGIDSESLSEKEMTQWFDKMFEAGAETLANGGILETDLSDTNGQPLFTDDNGEALTGTFYFIQDKESGDFYQVETANDEDGNILTGALGEPLLDTEQGVNKVVDGDLKNFLELQFMFVDLAAQAAGQLGTTDYNDYGEATFTGYDVNNLDHMREFSDLVKKTNVSAIESGQVESPLKVIEENGEIFLQKWDWANDMPAGIKIPLDELAGGSYDNGDMESYQLAMERSSNALEELGIGVGGKTFNLLAAQDNFEYSAQAGFSESELGFSDISGRNSDEFKNFANIKTTLSLLNTPSILDAQQSDETKDGKA